LTLARAAWATLGGALGEFARRVPRDLRNPGLIIGGDFTLTRERIAVAGSGLAAISADEDAYFTASITVIVEALQAKATASAMGRSIAELQRCPSALGAGAVRRALESSESVSPASGSYRVVLGPQPLAEILSYM